MRNKRRFLLFSLMFSLLLTSIISGTAIGDKASEEVTITVLGTSDVHGRYMPWDYAVDADNKSGSLSQLYTLVKEIRKENPNTILLDAGDLIQDNSSELFQDMDPHPAIMALNKMGYDAWTMGNHEFDYGLSKLDKIVNQFDGAVLTGNMYRENGEQYFDSYTIVERAGIKVGIIGMTTPMVAEFKEDTDIFDGIEFTNPTEETKKVIGEIGDKVDVLIGLMHMGMENENGVPNTGVTDIANANPELAVIFAGHMHKLHGEELVNDVLVVEPNKYATHLSRVDLTFEKDGDKFKLKEKKGTAIPIKQDNGSFVKSDGELEELLMPFHKIAREDANMVIGELVGLDMVPKNEIRGIPSVQIQETPLTNFFSEVMLYYSNGADVVAHQIDNDNARLDMGPIKKKDIAYNYQYAGGEVTVYKVKGQDLKDYMEWAVGYFNTIKPGDVTISFDRDRRASKYSTNDIFGGVKYDVDLREEYGNRIKNLRRLDDTPIALDEELKLGLNAYRMKALIGSGGALEGRTFEQLYSTQDEDAFGEVEGRIRNLAARYIRDVKNGTIEGKINNHWKIIGLDTKSPEREDVVELVNSGILELPKTEDGKYTNIASINVDEKLSADRTRELIEKAGVSGEGLENIERSGEFYRELNNRIKAKNNQVSVEKSIEKPVETPIDTPIDTQASEGKSVKEEIYTVKNGDVLWKIAARFGKTWEEVAQYNNLKNPHLIFPGQKLIILVD